MTTTNTKRWGGLLIAAALAAGGCGRGLLGIGGSGQPDASSRPDTGPVPPHASVCFPAHPASCDGICQQATKILWNDCSTCHADGPGSVGAPFDSLDPGDLTTSVSRTSRDNPIYVIPGDPDHSLLYVRAVILGDMPPASLDVAQPVPPHVTPEDARVLRSWITDCLGADTFDGGTPPPPTEGPVRRG